MVLLGVVLEKIYRCVTSVVPGVWSLIFDMQLIILFLCSYKVMQISLN